MTSALGVADPRGRAASAGPAAAIVNTPTTTMRVAAFYMDFADLYAATFHGLCMQLFAYTGDLGAAQDAVQEAFCRALPRWSTLSTYDDPAAWVRKVAWNLATSRWRQLRRLTDLGSHTPEQVVPAPTADRLDLMAALAKLPPRQRQAVVLHYLADASIAEIAQITASAEGTVKSWLHRARATLAEELAPSDTKSSTAKLGGVKEVRGA
jgi:RNA polymerase sigma-70 factor (ECF subfamily)